MIKAYRQLLRDIETDPDEEQATVKLSDGKTLTLTICGPAEVVRAEDWDHDDDDFRRRLYEEA